MLVTFQSYINTNKLFHPTEKILLTVSGGKDSMAMLHLFIAAKYTFGVAHCNFQLRGKEADKDELFVQQTCKQLNIPFHSIKFETTAFAEKNKVSTQMAARTLRYQWFEELRNTHNYNYIATAHHQNDVAETMLINLTKGTGLSGLHGIKNKKNTLIRPLLCFNSAAIQHYIEHNNISFREDLSNASTKYVRNKIRHEILPKLAEINPTIIETLNQSALHFSAVERILTQKIEEEKNRCFSSEKECIKINIEQLKKLTPLPTYLYYFLLPYHFNFDDCDQIANSLLAISGKRFLSSSHQLIKDREYLLLTSLHSNNKNSVTISTLEDFENSPVPIKTSVVSNENMQFVNNKKLAYLDADKITYPLFFRKWNEGDTFSPFGLKGKKKVSDFFIDEKFSILEKKECWLLTDKNDSIIWVVNSRIDNFYSVTPTTKKILLLEIL
ncbi:MAG: tRNA lysidine(34) synthetase TilS [Flavobacteriales bacterium CG18_big_fil_WC_8_21_14_2_50_32_9]|nr:MAG: tRNA lysidine(34) synthetase TilS [Flavobacteriales bacterium CG18_big_fil_WC_8_21_14_2_50_32_9]